MNKPNPKKDRSARRVRNPIKATRTINPVRGNASCKSCMILPRVNGSSRCEKCSKEKK